MNDELLQLLRHTDQRTAPPMLNSAALPARVRQSAEKQSQHRTAAGLIATIPMLACLLLMTIHHLHQDQSEKTLAQIDTSSKLSADLALQIAYHERVVSLLEAHHQASTPSPAVTDEFLQQLQLEHAAKPLSFCSAAARINCDPTQIIPKPSTVSI